MRWLDALPALMRQRKGLAIHRVGDNLHGSKASLVLDRQRLAWEDVRRTVTSQMQLIKDECLTERHVRPAPTRYVQPDLLAELQSLEAS
jgi:hypothetical protein